MSDERTARQRILLLIGSIGPLGYLPASGTVTVAAVGIPLFRLMSFWPHWLYAAFVVAFSALSVWIHQVGDRVLGEKDSRKLVWDELAGFMVAMAFVPFTWQLAAIGFALERAIDIAKIPPANWIEKRVVGGLGVVGDDLVAGAYTCGILHLLIRFAPGWTGPSV